MGPVYSILVYESCGGVFWSFGEDCYTPKLCIIFITVILLICWYEGANMRI